MMQTSTSAHYATSEMNNETDNILFKQRDYLNESLNEWLYLNEKKQNFITNVYKRKQFLQKMECMSAI